MHAQETTPSNTRRHTLHDQAQNQGVMETTSRFICRCLVQHTQRRLTTEMRVTQSNKFYLISTSIDLVLYGCIAAPLGNVQQSI